MVENEHTLRAHATAPKNRFDRMEWAGAFGDLGTLIPFVVAYISLLKMDPYGILLAFGIAKIVSGFYYKTPFPIQPMKAIGAVATTQAGQTITITPNAVYGAGIVTGVIWLLLGVTGAAKKVWECSRNDIASNVAVFVAAAGVWLTHSGWPDLLIGLVLAILFLRSAARVLRSAITELKRPARVSAEVQFVNLDRR